MNRQLTFSLPSQTALGRGDFYVSPDNAVAVDVIQTWHDWPDGKLVLVGPEGSGKTHLANIWSVMVDAKVVAASDVVGQVDTLSRGPVAVENVDQIAGDKDAEEALFHLHNLSLSQGSLLLFTARTPPARWNLDLPDLKSRMQGSAMVSLTGPDDELLTAILAKLFGDLQMSVEPEVLRYIVTRMERSFAGAGQLVAALDDVTLTEKRPVTKPLVARVLDKLGSAEA